MRHGIAAALLVGLFALSGAQAAAPINLPADEAAHPRTRSEWIYLSGHLAGGGQRYGFMAAFFRVKPQDGGIGAPAAFAVIALTDEARRSHSHTMITLAGSQAWNAERLALRYPGNRIDRVADNPPRFEAHLELAGALAAKPEMVLDLTLASKSPPLLINDGIIRFAQGRLTYYYSWPRLEASGTLRLRGRGDLPVTGTAWLDHQWGSFDAMEDVGRYDWFALQLSDGTSIILLDLAGPARRRLGRVMWPDGRQEAVDFETKPLGRWTSPVTEVTYPLGWTITLKQIGMSLRVTPVLQDQEISKLAPRPFWEGVCTVAGTRAGKPVRGRAFAELVGYDRGR